METWLPKIRVVLTVIVTAGLVAFAVATFAHETCGVRRERIRTDALAMAGLLTVALIAKRTMGRPPRNRDRA